MYEKGVLDQPGSRRVTTPVIVQTLFVEKHYTVHYITLKLYVNVALKILQVHRVRQLKQEKRLEHYISLHCRMRTQSKSKFEEPFYKLMNTSCYGTTYESTRNSVNGKLVKTREAVLESSNKGLLKSINIFDENLVALDSRGGQIYWDTPTLLDACIFDHAMFRMYVFRYKVSIKCQNRYLHP